MPLPVKRSKKNCLSSHSCQFVKKYFFAIILLHANVQLVYIMLAKYQIVPSKTVVGVDWPVNAITCKKVRKIV